MNIKEKQQGVFEIKQNGVISIIIGAILGVIGLIVLLASLFPPDFSQPGIYVGLILAGIGALLLFTAKTVITTINKNDNTLIYAVKKLNKKNERKLSISDVKEVIYSENLSITKNSSRNRGSSARIGGVGAGGGVQTNVQKTVLLALKTGETLIIYTKSTRYNPFFNKTRDSAQRLAENLGVPLKSAGINDAIKSVGNALFGNKNEGGQI
jgi:hypothetical protein